MRGEEQAARGGLSDGTESGGSPVVQGRRGRARTRGGGEDGRGKAEPGGGPRGFARGCGRLWGLAWGPRMAGIYSPGSGSPSLEYEVLRSQGWALSPVMGLVSLGPPCAQDWPAGASQKGKLRCKVRCVHVTSTRRYVLENKATEMGN